MYETNLKCVENVIQSADTDMLLNRTFLLFITELDMGHF